MNPAHRQKGSDADAGRCYYDVGGSTRIFTDESRFSRSSSRSRLRSSDSVSRRITPDLNSALIAAPY